MEALEGEHREQVIAIPRRFGAMARNLRAGEGRRTRLAADTRAAAYLLSVPHGVATSYRPGGAMSPEQIADDLVDWFSGFPERSEKIG